MEYGSEGAEGRGCGRNMLWRSGESVTMKSNMQAGNSTNHQIKRSNLQPMKAESWREMTKKRAGERMGKHPMCVLRFFQLGLLHSRDLAFNLQGIVCLSHYTVLLDSLVL